jgi:riboflavin synthase
MFSGIVEELAEVRAITMRGGITFLQVGVCGIDKDIKVGDSVAVNGVCLTVVKKEQGILSFEAMPETMSLTSLGSLRIKERVNVERALKIGERLSGHFVTGHVDCTGIIRRKHYVHNNVCFEITVPMKYMPYVLPKGSIALDGISLTIVAKRSNTFSVYIIPHTLQHTTLGFRRPTDKVNIEFDILAKKSTSVS